MPRIFISYRRADSAEITEKIYQRFVTRFGRRNVFKDVNSIPIGKDFRAVIEEELITCDMMLVIIGPSWLNISDSEGNRRLDNPEDAVRTEVELGLRHVQVIPVVVGGAPIPPEDELPRRLSQLVFQNAAFIRDDDFERDVQKLIETIAPRRRLGGRIGALLTVLVVVAAGIAFAAFNAARGQSPRPTEAVHLSTATNESRTPTETHTPLSTAITPSPMSQTTNSPTATLAPLVTDPLSSYAPITVDNAKDLGFGFAERGICRALDPTGRLFVTDAGIVYELASGRARLYMAAYVNFLPAFSPDGSLLAASNVGVYDLSSGQKRFSLADTKHTDAYPVFSPDGSLLAVSGDGVYDAASGQKRFSLDYSSKTPAFSANGLLLAAAGGVYDVASGQKRFSTNPASYTPVLSPNGWLVAVDGNGVFDIASGQKRFAIGGYYSSVFSPDSALLSVESEGVYDVVSGQKRFSTDAFSTVFSPFGTFLAANRDGVYDVVSGQKRFAVGGIAAPVFNLNETLLAVDNEGVYNVVDGNLVYKNPWASYPGIFLSDRFILQNGYQSCIVIGVKSNPWRNVTNVGITLASAYIRVEPDATAAIKDTLDSSALLIIDRYSEDNQWVSVGRDAWIEASYIKILQNP